MGAVEPAARLPSASEPPAGSATGSGSSDFYEEVDSLDLADLDALEEAPSHADDIEQKIKAAFPGTKFDILPEPDHGPDAGKA